MKRAFIVGGKRTPIGCFGGIFQSLSAIQLASYPLKQLLHETNVNSKQISEVILGNVLSTGLGQNPARQVALASDISHTVPCWNINKVCASGLKSTSIGASNIFLGHSDIVVTGGFESMSNAPHFIRSSRNGVKFGPFSVEDTVQYDGLVDAYDKIAMGYCGEKTAKEFNITREQQDEWCHQSYQRAYDAEEQGVFSKEIVGVEIKKLGLMNQDEEPRRFKPEKVKSLRAVFPDKNKEGTITAANASKLNDGACMLMLMSEQALHEQGIKGSFEIVGFADAESQPIDFNVSPAIAAKKALKMSGLSINDIDYWEINEAFSVTALVNKHLLEIENDRLNVHGGAVALGHPIGASGARIILSLMTTLREKGGKYGLAAICNGGGGASAIIVKSHL